MWLINALTLKLEYHNPPAWSWDDVTVQEDYAILSHTWGPDEISFQEFQTQTDETQAKNGWQKIIQTCRLTLNWNLRYCWIDTCCIDKTSSAELTEAVNSMFGWYAAAKICFAFLNDFNSDESLDDWSKGSNTSHVESCRWFSRGWTLQELIAPRQVQFLNSQWQHIGRKSRISDLLAQITGIDTQILTSDPKRFTRLRDVPVGKRMSWASRRETSRVEDIAYCLMGIFDVNMPLLYGEGPKAFRRLQMEIAKESSDLSLFAWKAETGDHIRGLLSIHPREFCDCSNLELRFSTQQSPPVEFGDTNIEDSRSEPDSLLLRLDPFVSRKEDIYIFIIKTTNGYVRHQADKWAHDDGKGKIWASPVYIPTAFVKHVSIPTSQFAEEQLTGAFRILTPGQGDTNLEIAATPGSHLWDPTHQLFLVNDGKEISVKYKLQSKGPAIEEVGIVHLALTRATGRFGKIEFAIRIFPNDTYDDWPKGVHEGFPKFKGEAECSDVVNRKLDVNGTRYHIFLKASRKTLIPHLLYDFMIAEIEINALQCQKKGLSGKGCGCVLPGPQADEPVEAQSGPTNGNDECETST